MNGEYRALSGIWAFIFLTLLLVFPLTQTAKADTITGSPITIRATVLPIEVIYVNNDSKITKIVSNTTKDMTPLVLSLSNPKLHIPFQGKIKTEYLSLKSNCTGLAKYGVIYNDSCQTVAIKKPGANFALAWIKDISAMPLKIFRA